jgi:excisionase family DNA binding protein
MPEDQVMTVEEVADYLKLNKQTVMRMAARGDLPAVKVGRHWRFRKEYIDARLQGEQPPITQSLARLGSAGYRIQVVSRNGVYEVEAYKGTESQPRVTFRLDEVPGGALDAALVAALGDGSKLLHDL